MLLPTDTVTRRRLGQRACLCAVALGLHLAALAAPLVPGDPVPVIALEDQHGKPVRVDARTRRLLFSAERSVNDMVAKVLSAQGSGVPVSYTHLDVYKRQAKGLPSGSGRRTTKAG